MSKYNLTYKPFGASGILIEWPAQIDEQVIQDIISFERLIAKDLKVQDTIIAYHSLMVRYTAMKHWERVVQELKELYAMERATVSQKQKIWCIPVCYDPQFGLDLEEIATQTGLSVTEVVKLHSQTEYLIYFLGFQPGFLYLGGLNTQIHTPRRANPRLRIEKGSVGIGGQQTGVYPQDAAGGWNIIGKSPIDFFDVTKPQPCFAKAGDHIQFVSIDVDTFYQIKTEVQKGNYELKFQQL